jgi:hypothetical protein
MAAATLQNFMMRSMDGNRVKDMRLAPNEYEARMHAS